MLNLKVMLSSIAFMAIAFTGCTSLPVASSTVPSIQTFKIDQQCPSDLTLAVGQTLQVIAEDNPSTGYSWKLRKALDYLDATSSYKAAKTEGYLIVGAGGMRTFNFTAKAVGQEKIHLVYTRSWTPQEVGRQWICDIKVQ